MTNPLSMFHDKVDGRDGAWSMTRVVAFFFALVFLYAMATYAYRAKEITWPFATLGAFILLAVPLQALLSFLGQWIASREGRQLLSTAVHKVEESLLGGAAAATPSVKVEASVGPTKGGK